MSFPICIYFGAVYINYRLKMLKFNFFSIFLRKTRKVPVKERLPLC